MGKKKFIGKGEGKSFHLLHRSQTDAAYADEATPSSYVLVPAQSNANDLKKVKRANVDVKLSSRVDHINPLGFKNDGYDYSQHLREMGGGKFIGADGRITDAMRLPPEGVLPLDALPSGEELERDYEAITISDKYMDRDIHDALFEEGDEDGEFEELQDDFVAQVMSAKDEPDFDFDAHIAKLIANSARDVDNVGARPWHADNKLKKQTGKSKPKTRVRFGDEAEGEGEEDNDDDEDDNDNDDDDSGVFSDDDIDHDDYYEDEEGSEGDGDTGPVLVTSEQRRFVESHFEKTLEEYGEDDLGCLSEADEDDIEGFIELDQPNDLLDEALEEFLESQKDGQYIDGVVNLQKGLRGPKTDEVFFEEERVVSLSEEQLRVEFERQCELQEQAAADIQAMNAEPQATLDEVLQCQQYMREERPVEEWDCETIISTYSTLDNHPKLIKEPNHRFKAHQSRYTLASEAALKAREQVQLDNEHKISEGAHRPMSTAQPTRIVLHGKYNLPLEFSRNGQPPPSNIAKTAINKAKSIIMPSSVQEQEQEEGDQDNEINSNDEADDKSEENDDNTAATGGTKRRNETAEEKKLRKQQVKEERRSKRASKKEVKNAYKSETVKQIRASGHHQDIDKASLFKYTV